MPRVSEAHLAARRQQILTAAQACFIRNGFHASTMHDVIAEADLSVGAVYRYFKSKNDLVEAIAKSYSDRLWDGTDSIVAREGSLAQVMEAAIDFIDVSSAPGGPFRLAIQVWSEALRDERIAVTTKRVYTRFRSAFVTMAARAVDAGHLPPDTDPEATGAALFSLVVGYGLQRVLTGGPDKETYIAGMRTLLKEIS